MAGVFGSWLSWLTGSRRRKVLLVSSDWGTVELVQTYLAPLKREWLVADSCSEAVAAMDRSAEAPALCIVDAQLAGTANGFELLRQIRARRDTFRTPVILLHQNLAMQDQSGLLAKFQHLFLMAKPIAAKTILDVCEDALRQGDRYQVAKSSLRVATPPVIRTRARQ